MLYNKKINGYNNTLCANDLKKSAKAGYLLFPRHMSFMKSRQLKIYSVLLSVSIKFWNAHQHFSCRFGTKTIFKNKNECQECRSIIAWGVGLIVINWHGVVSGLCFIESTCNSDFTKNGFAHVIFAHLCVQLENFADFVILLWMWCWRIFYVIRSSRWFVSVIAVMTWGYSVTFLTVWYCAR